MVHFVHVIYMYLKIKCLIGNFRLVVLDYQLW